MRKQITNKQTILTLMITLFIFMGLNAQKKVTYNLPGDYDNTAAALVGIQNDANIVDGDTVIINILESYTLTNNEALKNQMTKSLKITIQGAGADKTVLGPKTPNRWLNFNTNTVDGVEFIIRDLTVKGFGLSNNADGGCINVAKPGMKFSFINVNFEDMTGGVGTVFRALGDDQIVGFDNCFFTNNHTKKARGNPRGIIYKGNGGMLSIKNSTFISNYADVLDRTDPENPVDPAQKFGGVLDVVGSLTGSLDLIMENNVFVNNLVENEASSDTIQAMMVIKPRASNISLQMTSNIFIENRRDGTNDDIDILIWDTDSITYTLTDNIANNMYGAKLSDDEVPVEIIEPLGLDGFTTDVDFTYTHQDINFTMDGDLPEIMNDEYGVNYVTYSGPSATILVSAIDLSAEPDSVAVGGTLQIVAGVSPADATNKTVTWSVDNTDIATIDSNGLLTGITAGTVTVGATSVDGSDVTGNMTINVYGSTSVQENPYKKLNVYPNPSNGDFVVAVPGDIRKIEYDVINVIGARVQSGIFSGENNHLNLMDQPKGIYILKTSGEVTTTMRLVVR
jgi:uncharacterized protein YjdB